MLLSIIATPGRLLHILVEMNKHLREVTYVVFDEADRSVFVLPDPVCEQSVCSL